MSSTRHDAAVARANKTPPPFPRPLPTRPVPTSASAGCIALPPPRAPSEKKLLFFASSRACQYVTVTATSRRGSSARFDGDIKYVIIDASLVLRCVAEGGGASRLRTNDDNDGDAGNNNNNNKQHNNQTVHSGRGRRMTVAGRMKDDNVEGRRTSTTWPTDDNDNDDDDDDETKTNSTIKQCTRDIEGGG